MHERRSKVRRVRVLLAVFAGLVLVGTGVLGGVATALQWDGLLTPGPSWDDRYTIRSYDVVGALRSDGSFAVTEDIEVEWHEPRRGLIRDLDLSAPDEDRTLGVDGIDVTSRTQDDVWFEVRRDTDGVASIHLGEEVDFRPLGTDHYRISYVLDGLLVEWRDRATLRWDTFGDQWDTRIDEATVELDLPAGDHELACVVGARGEAFACDGDGPDWRAQELRPGRGVTVEARLDPAVAPSAGLPRARLDPLREFSTLALRRLGLIGGLGAASALPLVGTFGGAAARRRREEARQRVETTGATYVPPDGMRPLTGGYLAHGETSSVNDGHLFAAWLLDAQQRGLVEVQPQGKGFRARSTGGGAPDSAAEAAAIDALTSEPGWTTWDKKTPQGRRSLFEKTWMALRNHHAAEAGVPQLASARIGKGGLLLAAAALVPAAVLAVVAPAGAVAVVIGLGGAWLAHAFVNSKLRVPVAYVPEDRLELWRQVEGLRRFVDEAHAGQISGLAEDPTVRLDSPFLQLLPWVVAFGSGERWADRFGDRIQADTQRYGFYAPVRAREISTVRSVSRPQSSSSGGGSSGVGSGGGGGGGSSR